MKRRLTIGVFILVLATLTNTTYSQTRQFRWLHASLSAGFGLPKIPFSHFRTPVSVEGGAAMNFRLLNKWLVQLDGYVLHTFSLGTASREEGELQFDVNWVSLNIMRSMRRGFRNENFISAGFGKYFLTQQFDNDKEKIETYGISLGIANWTHWTRWSMVSEIRWHLMFDSTPKPQVLTITLGMLF